MKSYYYIYRVGHSKPTIKHYSLSAAVKESQRLSNQHPGDAFEILKCLAITMTTTANTFWMDDAGPEEMRESNDE
jgi:hypothetical protein